MSSNLLLLWISFFSGLFSITCIDITNNPVPRGLGKCRIATAAHQGTSLGQAEIYHKPSQCLRHRQSGTIIVSDYMVEELEKEKRKKVHVLRMGRSEYLRALKNWLAWVLYLPPGVMGISSQGLLPRAMCKSMTLTKSWHSVKICMPSVTT